MTRDFPAGNYRFIPAVFQYSSGAVADSGFEVERVRFDRMPHWPKVLRRSQNIFRPRGGR